MLDLSIIVPVYNVEEYIDRCIKSLIAQNLYSYEIILVDDGSTDNSSEIINDYSKKYNNVISIHQKNLGLSGARNTGLKLARGEYIVFVDSDDYLIENSLYSLLNQAKAEQLDVGIANFNFVFEDNTCKANEVKPRHISSIVDGSEFFYKCLLNNELLCCVWKSIYRRSFLIQNDLFFREGYNHEDEEWTPRVYLVAKKVTYIDIIFYNYFIRSNSISKNVHNFEKNSFDLISNCYVLKELSQSIKRSELRNLFQDYIARVFLSAFYKGKLIEGKYSHIVNSSFFDDMYLCSSTKKKVLLFKVSRRLYYYINFLKKTFFIKNNE